MVNKTLPCRNLAQIESDHQNAALMVTVQISKMIKECLL